MTDPEYAKRKCKWCGRTFRVKKGESKRRACPDCEPPLPLEYKTR